MAVDQKDQTDPSISEGQLFELAADQGHGKILIPGFLTKWTAGRIGEGFGVGEDERKGGED